MSSILLITALVGVAALASGGALLFSRSRSAPPEPPAPPAPVPAPAAAAKPAPPKPAAPPPSEHTPFADDEVTIVGLSPIVLDAESASNYADSKVEEVDDLGTTKVIIHDVGAADDEPTSTHALILVSAVGQTHRGRKRKLNEDDFVVLHDHHLFVVADGMGGYAGGEIASKLAVDTIQAAFEADGFRGATGDVPRGGAQVAAAIQMANRAIWERAQAEPQLTGMGTTVVAARFSPRKERVYIGHVGDSRCYRFRAGKLAQVTKDHTLEAYGIQGPKGAALTRAVGIGPKVEVDVVLAEPMVGDAYLICSDGLTKMVPDSGIEEVLQKVQDPEQIVEALIARANLAGGKDNVTAIIVQVCAPDQAPVTAHDGRGEAGSAG